jgi:hypothetical protein
MIVTRIIGGLGNQMFQYALGRRLSIERGEPLKLDTSGFETYTLHGLALDHLALEGPRAEAEEIRALTHVPPRFPENLVPRKWLPRALRRSRRFAPRHYVEREGFRFDPAVLAAPSPLYLDGYWQSERYFETIPDVIRSDFTVPTPLAGRDAEIADLIADSKAVSLHVRRGDYASDPKTREIHGLCSLDYYAAAVAHMAGHVDEPRYFVFSDDPTWAAANLVLPGEPVFVDHNGADTNYEDLRLMSLCRHHVIANSSFSWWGAWLNEQTDKVVVAPRRWVGDPSLACPDICPPDWVRL